MNKKVMKKIKSQWVVATIFTAMLGVSMLAPTEVSASEWRARTPEQIEITDRSHYDIIWGDTLWAISESSGVSIGTLVQINNIANRDLIYAGNILIIEGNTITVAEPNGNTQSFEVNNDQATSIRTSESTKKTFTDNTHTDKIVEKTNNKIVKEKESTKKTFTDSTYTDKIVEKTNNKIAKEKETILNDLRPKNDVKEETSNTKPITLEKSDTDPKQYNSEMSSATMEIDMSDIANLMSHNDTNPFKTKTSDGKYIMSVAWETRSHEESFDLFATIQLTYDFEEKDGTIVTKTYSKKIGKDGQQIYTSADNFSDKIIIDDKNNFYTINIKFVNNPFDESDDNIPAIEAPANATGGNEAEAETPVQSTQPEQPIKVPDVEVPVTTVANPKPVVPVSPSITIDKVQSLFKDRGYNIEIGEYNEGIEVIYTIEIGSANQNIPETLKPAMQFVKRKLSDAGVVYSVYDGGMFFVIDIPK